MSYNGHHHHHHHHSQSQSQSQHYPQQQQQQPMHHNHHTHHSAHGQQQYGGHHHSSYQQPQQQPQQHHGHHAHHSHSHSHSHHHHNQRQSPAPHGSAQQPQQHGSAQQQHHHHHHHGHHHGHHHQHQHQQHHQHNHSSFNPTPPPQQHVPATNSPPSNVSPPTLAQPQQHLPPGSVPPSNAAASSGENDSRTLISFLEKQGLVKHAGIDQLIAGQVPTSKPPQHMSAEMKSWRPMASIDDAKRVGPKGKYRIAVDGNHLLSSMTHKLHEIDPAWFLEGPLSPILKSLLKEEVNKWLSRNFDPVFVFSGMAVHGDVESFVNTPEELAEREAAWVDIQSRQRAEKELMDKAFDVVLGEDVEMALMRYMADVLNVEVVRAPFLQWGQMVAFLVPPHRNVNDVCGPAELLLFDHVARVICEIDFEHGMISYVDKQDVLTTLFPNYAQNPPHVNSLFLDLGLLTASHQSLALLRPDLEIGSIEELYAEIKRLDEQQCKISDLVYSQFSQKQDANHETWKLMKGRAFIRHSVVLSPQNGEVQPLSKLLKVPVRVPKNLVGVLGSRLPPFIYYLQFIGLLSVGSTTTISQNYIRDDNPVSDTLQYRNCMEVVISLRTQVLYQLVQHFQRNEDYRKRVKVSWIRWFEPISIPVLRPPDIRLDSWDLRDLTSEQELSREELQKISFKDVVRFASKGVRSENDDQARFACRTLEQFMTAILLKSLDLLGYFTHITNNAPEMGVPNSEPITGPSLYADILAQDVPFREHASLCIMLVELLRTSSLTNRPLEYVQPQQNAKTPQQSPDEAAIIFATRVATLVNVETKAEVYPGIIDRDVVSFNVIVKNFHRTLRTLTEVITASMFLDGSCQCNSVAYVHIPSLLPFAVPPNCVGGFLMKYLLSSLAKNFGLPQNAKPEQYWKVIEAAFSTVADICAAVTDVVLFWETAHAIMKKLREREIHPVVSDEMAHSYERADAMVAQLRSVLAL